MIKWLVLATLIVGTLGLSTSGNQTLAVQATGETEFTFDSPLTNANLVFSTDVNTNYRIYTSEQYSNYKTGQTAVSLAEVQNSNYTTIIFSTDPSIKTFWVITSAAIDWLPDETYYITVHYSTSMYFPILPTVLGVGIGVSIMVSILAIVLIVRHYRSKRQAEYTQL